jgi:hypothetical protein
MGIFDFHLPINYGKKHSVFGRPLQDTVACYWAITGLDCNCLPGDIISHNIISHNIISHKAPSSVFQKSVDRRVLKCMRAEHHRARYQLNCRRNLQRRLHNTRRHNTRSPDTRRHTRYSQPAHSTEACQITLYITAKITHYGVHSPCVRPLADARSVK